LHNISVLTAWGAKVEDDRVPLAGYSNLAASGSEVNTCGRKHWKINQKSQYSFILIKVLFICFFFLIKMYFKK